MTDMIQLPAADFAALASGRGGRAVVDRLRAGQLSKNLLLFRGLLDAGAIDARVTGLLADAQDADPDAFAAVFTYPTVGAWAADSHRVLRGVAASPLPVPVMLGHAAGIAAAAAYTAGLDFVLDVPVRAGAVSLPGLGRAVAAGERAVVAATGGVLEVDGVPVGKLADAHDWLPVRRLTAEAGGLRLTVTLDDVDPYRDGHDMGATGRLEQAAVDRWQATLGAAWAILVADHREYAGPIAAGLRTIVPLRGDVLNRGVTATSMDAFGAVASSTPADEIALAVGLVHEFQHGKLGALMDLMPLHTGGDEERFYAPWRDDPRPLGGLLHGAYAFLGVADFWRVRRRHERNLVGYAQFEFVRWRERVSRVIDVLAGSGRLTPDGRALLAGMRDVAGSWWDEPVPDGVGALARSAAEDHRVAWRVRNLVCDPAAVTRMADAWRAGAPAPADAPATEVRASPRVFRRPARLHLTALRLTAPETLAGLAVGDPELHASAPDATAADLAYARGEIDAARDGYLALIAAEPEVDGHWAGLALCLTEPGALATGPEWVAAVHRELAAESPGPLRLAGWLAPAVTG